jgi:serine-type D-Ala-D-Ala carboxypeptidase/endopeptidase (penicillin-binding protein 4)
LLYSLSIAVQILGLHMFRTLFFSTCAFIVSFHPAFPKDLSSFFSTTPAFQRAHTGIHIIELETGKEVYQRNADQYFVTASLQKIPVSVAALHLLGENYCFKTDLEYEGNIDEEGILHGNLWVRGGGDPTLPITVLSEWGKALKAIGIQKIDGKIYVDASCFETALASPYWMFQDLGNYYGAGASAITINENLYRITFQTGKKEGDPATVIQIDPPIPGLIFHNEVKTGPAGSGDRAYVFGTEYSPVQYYRGTVPLDHETFTIKAAIPDPASFCAALLQNQFNPTKGVSIEREKNKSSSPCVLICSHTSPSLKKIVTDMNLFSINLYAEHLLKTIGQGNAETGIQKIEMMLGNWQIPAQIKDGAGLARNNLITPRGFVLLLSRIKKSPLYQTLYSTFPEPENIGTLRSFPALASVALRAKTGSMSNVYTLGGYFTMPSGKEYAFSIFCNNYQGPLKEIKDEMYHFLSSIVEQLTSSSP